MQRYQNYTEIIKQTTGKRRYSTLYYPAIKRKTSDRYIMSKTTDRLDLLAKQYYGDPRYWIIIAKANRLHDATLVVPAGVRIRIPFPIDLTELQNEFDDLNENSI